MLSQKVHPEVAQLCFAWHGVYIYGETFITVVEEVLLVSLVKKKKETKQTKPNKQTQKQEQNFPPRYLRYTLLLAVDLSLVSLTPVFVHGFFFNYSGGKTNRVDWERYDANRILS